MAAENIEADYDGARGDEQRKQHLELVQELKGSLNHGADSKSVVPKTFSLKPHKRFPANAGGNRYRYPSGSTAEPLTRTS